ncbi:hypothetical protein FOA52_008164 [Chlamydomonas sp. UWO 241]|nr:hypothetical protein FOA52_008164 [Chlamydomonas sp. UWO 241]
MSSDNPRLCFISEWLDPNSGVLWRYQLFFFKNTNEVEMVDIKNRKTFLKKTRIVELKLQQLFVGATVTIYSRLLKITDYGDEFTRSQIAPQSESTLAMVKPDAYAHLGKILNAVSDSRLRVNKLRVCELTRAQAEAFYAVHAGKPFFDKLVDFMSSGRVAAMELVGQDAIARWRALIGPTDSNRARAEAPNTIRAHFGIDGSYNAVHGSDAPDTAAEELSFFFSNPLLGKCDRGGAGTTLGLIKPHSVAAGMAGLVLDVVADSFDIVALRQVQLDKASAEEFLEVYKGVLPGGDLNAAIDELTSGPCIAFEVAARGGGAPVEPFRELCGPSDPEPARALRPKSLRAQFGLTKVRNAVHCTDLAGDTRIEVEYFFDLLLSQQ